MIVFIEATRREDDITHQEEEAQAGKLLNLQLLKLDSSNIVKNTFIPWLEYLFKEKPQGVYPGGLNSSSSVRIRWVRARRC